MRFEREEDLRHKMIDAADQFSTAYATASSAALYGLMTISDMQREELVDASGEPSANVRKAVKDVLELVEKVATTLPRVLLLFRFDSPAGIHAQRALRSLYGSVNWARWDSRLVQERRRARGERPMPKWKDAPEVYLDGAQGWLADAGAEHSAFQQEALRALRIPQALLRKKYNQPASQELEATKSAAAARTMDDF